MNWVLLLPFGFPELDWSIEMGLIKASYTVMLMGVIIYPARGWYRSCLINIPNERKTSEYADYGWFYDRNGFPC
jgi:hypothetical protein